MLLNVENLLLKCISLFRSIWMSMRKYPYSRWAKKMGLSLEVCNS